MENFAFMFTETDSRHLSEDKVCSNTAKKKKNRVGAKCCSGNNVNTYQKKEKHFTGYIFQLLFKKSLCKKI